MKQGCRDPARRYSKLSLESKLPAQLEDVGLGRGEGLDGATARAEGQRAIELVVPGDVDWRRIILFDFERRELREALAQVTSVDPEEEPISRLEDRTGALIPIENSAFLSDLRLHPESADYARDIALQILIDDPPLVRSAAP
jgi:hypothetical protein